MKIQATISSKVHNYYWNQNLNCAVTTLTILSEIFSIPLQPQVIQGTLGLNAGRYSSQCGLVQGSLFFIGIYAHHQGIELPRINTLCHQFSNEFQRRFTSLLCYQLRPEGFSPENPPHLCENLTILAISFTTEFIHREFNPDVMLF